MTAPARGKLDGVDFGDSSAFVYLTADHALLRQDPHPDAETITWKAHNGTTLRTTHDPEDSENEQGEGYAGEVTVSGPPEQAEELYRDVLDSCVQIKGEFYPLRTDAGTICTFYDRVER